METRGSIHCTREQRFLEPLSDNLPENVIDVRNPDGDGYSGGRSDWVGEEMDLLMRGPNYMEYT